MTTRHAPFSALRAFITLLVIAHHSVLAYHPYAPVPLSSLGAEPRLWPAFPVVDAHRWSGSELFVAFNDQFFMALMFLVSGLFVWPSLQRKGPARFLGDRLLRLGVPFALAALVLAPAAYWPSFRQAGGTGLRAFAHDWFALPFWPAGPAWFLWVLVVLAAVVAGLTVAVPTWATNLGERLAGLSPGRLGVMVVLFTSLTSVPLALAFDERWFSLGPFSIQASRLLLYPTYFLLGVALGTQGFEQGLLASQGPLQRGWRRAVLTMLGAFAAFLVLAVMQLVAQSRGEVPGLSVRIAGQVAALSSCAASSLAMLALALRFAKPGAFFDRLQANSYGMYLFHYVVVTWLQFALLEVNWPGAAKALVVLGGATMLSWALTALLRHNRVITRVL